MTTTVAVAARANGAALTEGHMPAVVYGPKQEPISISLEEKSFDKIRREAGESTIIELVGLDETIEVLIKDVAFDPVKQQILHADFYAIERGKEMVVTVGFEFVGEAPAEKSGLGSVTKAMHEIEVTCMPRNLPAEIVVDVTVLKDAHDKITVADLPKLEGVVYGAAAEETVAVVSVAAEEVDTDPEEVDMDAIPVVGAKEGGEESAE